MKLYAQVAKSLYLHLLRRNWLTSRRVDFVGIGAQKSGTTALYHYLRRHPEIGMSNLKEVHFFSDDRLFKLPKAFLYAHYHRFFTSFRRRDLRLGEFTPVYMTRPRTIDRIREYNPRMKLVVILRDPVSRAFSAWNHYTQKGWERRSFTEVVEAERHLPADSAVLRYLHRGLYAAQLEFILSRFHRSQVLILFQDDLRANPVRCLASLTQFLGVSPFQRVDPLEVHVRQYEQQLSDDMEEQLRAYYRTDTEKLEQMLGVDLGAWTKQR